MKYINQRDYPEKPYITRTEMQGEAFEKGQKTTVKSSACGLCSAIIVLDRLLVHYDFDLDDAIQMSYDTKANHRVGTDYARFAPAFAERFGLKYETTNDTEKLLHCLHTGGVAVANVGGDREGYTGVFSHIGHYIVIINEEPDGRVAILDPSFFEGKYEEEGRQGKVELKNQNIEICKISVLKKDVESRVPSFHLFWRA